MPTGKGQEYFVAVNCIYDRSSPVKRSHDGANTYLQALRRLRAAKMVGGLFGQGLDCLGYLLRMADQTSRAILALSQPWMGIP